MNALFSKLDNRVGAFLETTIGKVVMAVTSPIWVLLLCASIPFVLIWAICKTDNASHARHYLIALVVIALGIADSVFR